MGLPLTDDAWPGGSLRTERLLLRAPGARDREAFLDLGSDPVVNQHLGGGQDRAALDSTLPEVPADRPAQYVMEREGRFLGWIGLSRREAGRPGVVAATSSDHAGVLELSYVLPVDAWGHGYAAEACAALLDRADERLGEDVVLCTQVANTRSRALAERLGFEEADRFEEHGAEQWFGVRHPSLRRAVAADTEAVHRVAEAAYSPYLARMDGLRPGPLDTDYAAAIDDIEAWVALDGSTVVGFLLLVPEADGVLLENVAVLPTHHGRGLGRRLLRLAESRARALGLPRIRLYTHVTMVENQALYARAGYVETHRAGEAGLLRVFYEKAL